ncbi:MAG: alanyl-tRNA editing protein, partial [Anaerolineae bacterium]|nr:alanyl-tRNA editing protein [Anaerolineae bacterium]
TGQHILSQAFVEACGAETVSFHLGEQTCTIDLDRAPLSPTEVARAERLVAAVVMQDRPVVSRFVDQAELADLPLRKAPVVEGPVRIVQVEAFDWSPCGGTHVSRTGEVGLVKVLRVERRKDVSRVHFVCGWRAVADYAHKHEVIQTLTAHLTTSDDEILPSFERLEAELKESRKALFAVQAELLEYQVCDWLAHATPCGEYRIVQVALGDADPALLREAARRVTEHEGTVALLATAEPRPQFVFAAAEGVGVDVGELMRTATATVGGRGGGRGQFAQGGAPEGTSVQGVLDAAYVRLSTVVQRGTSP